ncbi:MAG TPA: hypothetical protein VJ778_15535 [Burkholderiales bacterium]|nr:hypothetical protein [Burkholderiales bacterium]
MPVRELVELSGTAVELAGVALIVAIRTFLSWSLALELEGRWPLQRPAQASHHP